MDTLGSKSKAVNSGTDLTSTATVVPFPKCDQSTLADHGTTFFPTKTMKVGKKAHPLYSAWNAMRRRCSEPGHKSYSSHGARGISVYKPWNEFWTFVEDIADEIGPRPSPNHTLDRIDNNGNYEPGNIRWATKKEQANNRSSNRCIQINGVTLTISECADLFGVSPQTIAARISNGWDPEEAARTPTGAEAVRSRSRKDTASGFLYSTRQLGTLAPERRMVRTPREDMGSQHWVRLKAECAKIAEYRAANVPSKAARYIRDLEDRNPGWGDQLRSLVRQPDLSAEDRTFMHVLVCVWLVKGKPIHYPHGDRMPEHQQNAIMVRPPALGRGKERADWQIDPELAHMLKAWAPDALVELSDDIECARLAHIASLEDEEY